LSIVSNPGLTVSDAIPIAVRTPPVRANMLNLDLSSSLAETLDTSVSGSP